MATLRCQKSFQNGDLYSLASPEGTIEFQIMDQRPVRHDLLNDRALTSVVPMTLDIPPSMGVCGIVLLVTSHLDLLPSPLRQGHVGSLEVTTQDLMPEPHPRGQRVDLVDVLLLAQDHVIDDLDDPMIMYVADGQVSIGGHFIVLLGHRRWNRVRVYVPGGGYVHDP
jgi:hypothetical protein